MALQETSTWLLRVRKLDIPSDILDAITVLPRYPEIEINFVDLDGTILDDTERFAVDPELKNRRWDTAYPYIVTKYSQNGDEDEAFDTFLRAVDPSRLHLKWHTKFYDPNNIHHIILTAWNLKFQKRKVDLSNLNPDPDRVILVEDAKSKPLAMLQYFLKIGYIPGKVRFIDDRIDNFEWIDEELSALLHTDVNFYRALPNAEDKSVQVTKVVAQKVESTLPHEWNPFYIPTTRDAIGKENLH
jgi:hypothetical protein